MATGDTAPPVALSSSPPPVLDRSPSNLSSPLSDVEDKDADPDGMELDSHNHSSAQSGTQSDTRSGTPTHDKAAAGADESALASDSDDESKLSDVDTNGSEAETERFYDSPHKNATARDPNNGTASPDTRKTAQDRHHRPSERTPSKLQKEVRTAAAATKKRPRDKESASEADRVDADDDAQSVASSQPRGRPSRGPLPQQKKPQPPALVIQTTVAPPKDQHHKQQASPESRKRKRPQPPESSESDQPLRKRLGSIGAPEHDLSADDVAVVDDEAILTNPHSTSDHSVVDDNHGEALKAATNNEEAIESVEQDSPDLGSRSPLPKSIKPKRHAANKKRKSQSPEPEPDDAQSKRRRDEDGEPTRGPATGHKRTRRGEEETVEDINEGAEVAHRNEEEMERRRAAHQELAAIEKQFSSFRERLYQERLDQLNQEEAMLTCEPPTHPEYLAMLHCIDERRDERIRLGLVELQLKLGVLERRSVAERAQILSQHHQSIREAREEALEDLGKEWYEIQHERRRAANDIPDYIIRFPTTKAQTIRHAVAYNKEVSVLSGMAKHVGFPAAPDLQGASEDQLETDFETIIHNRESIARVPHPPPQQPPIGYLGSLELTGAAAGLPYGRNLGAAGEQFIQQTPWANPEHPSHHHIHPTQQQQQPQPQPQAHPRAPLKSHPAQVQQSENGMHAVSAAAAAPALVSIAASMPTLASAGPPLSSSGNAKRHSHQAAVANTLSNALLTNGGAASLPMQRAPSAIAREAGSVGGAGVDASLKTSHRLSGPLPAEQVMKREGVAQLS